jgi:uncharacterized protein YfbU (UPF0304 family)
MNRFTFLIGHHAKDFNSHREMVDKYRAMLAEYEKYSVEERNKMTAEQIKALLAVR